MNIPQKTSSVFQNGTVFVSREFCEPSCITERGFFHEEIDDDIFNMIFPQVSWKFKWYLFVRLFPFQGHPGEHNPGRSKWSGHKGRRYFLRPWAWERAREWAWEWTWKRTWKRAWTSSWCSSQCGLLQKLCQSRNRCFPPFLCEFRHLGYIFRGIPCWLASLHE